MSAVALKNGQVTLRTRFWNDTIAVGIGDIGIRPQGLTNAVVGGKTQVPLWIAATWIAVVAGLICAVDLIRTPFGDEADLGVACFPSDAYAIGRQA